MGQTRHGNFLDASRQDDEEKKRERKREREREGVGREGIILFEAT